MKNFSTILLYLILALLPTRVLCSVEFQSLGQGKAVSNDIYGINDLISFKVNRAVQFPVTRFGGNHTSRYNYKINTSNHAKDWYFMNIPYDYIDGKNHVDHLIDEAIRSGSKLLITIPMIGWVAGKRSYKYSYSVKKYGKQKSVETANSKNDAGNGMLDDGRKLYKTDLKETSVEVGPEFVAEWVTYIKKRVAGRMPLNFALDNEPMIWHATHRDLRYNDPKALSPELSYDELWKRTVAYAGAIKKVAPEAKVFGPAAWGWCAYNYSSKDGCSIGADRMVHGNKPLLEWYLSKVCSYKKKTGIRLVDYLDIHYYPAYAYADDDEGQAAQKARLAAIKELYDWNYTSKNWINSNIALIPRMKKMIRDNCEGTKLAITEYRFGKAQDGRTTFLANAEAISLFATYGVDFATMWVSVQKNSLIEETFKLYLDYDGKGANALNSKVLRFEKSKKDSPVDTYGLVNKNKRLIYAFNKSLKPQKITIKLKSKCTSLNNYYVKNNTKYIQKFTMKPSKNINATLSPYSVNIFECK